MQRKDIKVGARLFYSEAVNAYIRFGAPTEAVVVDVGFWVRKDGSKLNDDTWFRKAEQWEHSSAGVLVDLYVKDLDGSIEVQRSCVKLRHLHGPYAETLAKVTEHHDAKRTEAAVKACAHIVKEEQAAELVERLKDIGIVAQWSGQRILIENSDIERLLTYAAVYHAAVSGG